MNTDDPSHARPLDYRTAEPWPADLADMADMAVHAAVLALSVPCLVFAHR